MLQIAGFSWQLHFLALVLTFRVQSFIQLKWTCRATGVSFAKNGAVVRLLQRDDGLSMFSLPDLAKLLGVGEKNRTDLLRNLTEFERCKAQVQSHSSRQETICITSSGLVKILRCRLRSVVPRIRHLAEAAVASLTTLFASHFNTDLESGSIFTFLCFSTSLLLQFLTVAAVRDSAEDAPIPSSTNRRKLAVVRRGKAKRQQTRQLQTSSASSASTSATFTSPFLILAPTIPPPSPAVVPISLNSSDSDSADREALLVSATRPQNQNTHTLLPQLPQDPSMSACSAAPSHLSESIPNSIQHALTLSTASTVNSLNFPARRGRRAANKLTLQARRGRELEQKAAHPVSSSSVSTSLCESTALLSD